MTSSKTRILAAVAGALSMGAAAAWAADAQDAKIQELEQKVASLEARQASNSKEMAATIDSVLRDAERRSQLLATTGDTGAGYDNGFYIRAGDAWVFRPGIEFQFRNVTEYRKDVAGGSNDKIENGFEIHRLAFIVEGTAFTKDLEYRFNWNTSSEGGSLSLEDAWVKYMFADDWGFRAGQFRDPVVHESLVSEKRQLAASWSLMNDLIGGGVLDRVQGASLIYGGYNKNNPISAEVALHDGANTDNTDYTKVNFDFGVAGRLEWKAMGDWRSYRDFSALGNKEDLFVLGLGGDWSQSGDGDLLTATVDAQYENSGGLGVYGAFVVSYKDDEISGTGDSSTDWGFVVQAGYMLNAQWEIFGRWDITDFDNDRIKPSGETQDTFNEFTVGVNYYLGTNGSAGHRAKVTVDLSYLPDGSPINDTSLGFQGDGDEEWVIRGQFQLLL